MADKGMRGMHGTRGCTGSPPNRWGTVQGPGRAWGGAGGAWSPRKFERGGLRKRGSKGSKCLKSCLQRFQSAVVCPRLRGIWALAL